MTPEREEKIEFVLAHRQPTLTIVMENVNDPHNIMAVCRSCDSVGVQDVHIIHDPNKDGFNIKRQGSKSSSSANKWLDFHFYEKTEDCLNQLKQDGFKLFSTHLNSESVDLYDVDMTQKIALIFGNEKHGVSQEALEMSDGNFIIPQVGMIQSLNISVACAVSLYEAFRQRQQAGFYQHSQLTEPQFESIFTRWTKPKK